MKREKRKITVKLNNKNHEINGVIDVKKNEKKRYFNIRKKKVYLNANDPFRSNYNLTDRVYCQHCGELITVGDYKIEILDNNKELICCPNAPECDGTIIDWIDKDLKEEQDKEYLDNIKKSGLTEEQYLKNIMERQNEILRSQNIID